MIGYVVEDVFRQTEEIIMTEAIIRERLAELNDLLATSPFLTDSNEQSELGTYLSGTRTENQVLGEAIDTARLRIRYLVFDLEATKRENQYLRQMLEIRKPKRKDDKNDSLDSF
jgi:hypothetical protein